VKAVVRLVAPRPGDEILNAGCGPGRIARVLQERGVRVWGIDLSQQMLVEASPWLHERICGDFEALDLGRTFDSVICSGALEFTSDPQAAFGTLARHVRPGGSFVVLVPLRGVGGLCYRWVQRRRGMEVHLFSTSALAGWARANGLQPNGRSRPFIHNRVMSFRRAS
jgi:ubiquinone/menaquinone biosynthesis C-methylase UbiE